MNAFLRSTPGRVIVLSIGLALLVGGVGTMVGTSLGPAILCVALMIGFMGGFIATGMATRNWPVQALVTVLAVPPALFAYALGLGYAVGHQLVSAGFVLVGAGLLAISIAALIKPSSQMARRPIPRIAHRSA